MRNLVFFFFSSRRRHTRWNCDWSSDVCSSDLAWFSSLAKAEFDDEYGGFGRGAKFPHAETLRALLLDPSAHEIVVRSLDALDALHDPGDGSLCRLAASRDWSEVAPEKLLADQAAVL